MQLTLKIQMQIRGKYMQMNRIPCSNRLGPTQHLCLSFINHQSSSFDQFFLLRALVLVKWISPDVFLAVAVGEEKDKR